ncbi:MAG: metallophosphoesterase family protein, partial [Planctomycetaceae bacterium]
MSREMNQTPACRPSRMSRVAETASTTNPNRPPHARKSGLAFFVSGRRWWFAVCLWTASVLSSSAWAESFRVLPYVQNPAADAMTIRWFSHAKASGTLTVFTPEGEREFTSEPKLAGALAHNPFKPEPGDALPAVPWLHSIRVTGLEPGTEYQYAVRQGEDRAEGAFHTAPDANQPIRLVAYADSETEPESTGKAVDWPAHASSNRPDELKNYVVDQTVGYEENIRVMNSRDPDLILVVGDLVESGGEQRDWDEFWRHNAGELGAIASRVPILAAIGNHENYGGPGGGYSAEGANFSTDKYLTYFEFPSNAAANEKHRGRYYRIDYGPIALITVDSSDGLPHQTAADTNHSLDGSNAPDFNPGSEQYRWLEAQLADAQQKSRFTFVQFHHTMYGSGPHSVPFGSPNFSGQSGIAMRIIQPLLFKYGVDAVLSGHDEMLERSHVTGTETLPDGSTRPHEIHFYDVGMGGDGLRGPSEGFDNPYRKYLAHEDAPEVWEGKRLLSGGKHYGHLEINVAPNDDGVWQTTIVPVQIFPLMDDAGIVTGWERREIDDEVTLTSQTEVEETSAVNSAEDEAGVCCATRRSKCC